MNQLKIVSNYKHLNVAPHFFVLILLLSACGSHDRKLSITESSASLLSPGLIAEDAGESDSGSHPENEDAGAYVDPTLPELSEWNGQPCDGPESCPDGFRCLIPTAWGAEMGPVCMSVKLPFCRTSRDCEGDLHCIGQWIGSVAFNLCAKFE